MTTKRSSALITGYGLLLMAVIAGFALGYAYPLFYAIDKTNMIVQQVHDHRLLYSLMIAALIAIALLDCLASWGFFQFFKDENRPLSLLSALLRLGYTILFGVAIFFLFKNLNQENDSSSMLRNWGRFDTIWSTGLMIFGTHLFTVAMLMRQHRFIPSWMWTLTLIAGISYFVIHLIKLSQPDSVSLIDYLNKILGLPMALGEICLAIWLIVKGGRPDQKSDHYS